MNQLPRKKLIEVALPLEAINEASAREKSIRHGHPSTLHLWWARRPLAAARAVIFSQMVDDPSEYVQELTSPGTESRRVAERELKKKRAAWEARPSKEEGAPAPALEEIAADIERQRLFKIIEELVQWESTTNEEVLKKARDEIWRSWRRTCAENADHPQAKDLFDRDKLPGFHDPFAGGGALPLEAQRLGLESYASDLNPVAVLINKAMIEIPPKFANQPPVNPDAQAKRHLSTWKGAQGLAEDVRYYGQWMRNEAEKRIGHLYPRVKVTREMVADRPDLRGHEGKELTVIAWIWARTVKSPNPAFRNVSVPLAPTFMLSTRPGNEAFVEPVVSGPNYSFSAKLGTPPTASKAKLGTKLSRGANFACLMSGAPIDADYIRAEGRAKRMGRSLIGIVAHLDGGRTYLSPTEEAIRTADEARAPWRPEVDLFEGALGFRVGGYGLTQWGDLFTERQLLALNTFSGLISEARQRILVECGDSDYADAVAVYLACAVSRASDYWGTGAIWESTGGFVAHVFTRNALPMTWDFPEANPFSSASGSWSQTCLDWIVRYLQTVQPAARGQAERCDAQSQSFSANRVVSTDPPYYDNIGYADLSDYFYMWLRRSLQPILPDLFGTIAVPKAEELVATPARHGGRIEAERFFLRGMTLAMARIRDLQHPSFPVSIYYAFRQAESSEDGKVASTGWETFLEAVMQAGFAINGTWPVRTERPGRMRDVASNALASSIVLVCRPRLDTALSATRREFLNALQKELPKAIADLQRGNVAPVDLQQAAIGPGMAIFTRYAKVLDADGKPLSVRDALTMINQALDEVLAKQEGDFDSDTRWALTWFEQFGFAEGDYGTAETLAVARNTSVRGVVDAGIVTSGKGKVRLLKPEELPDFWTPEGDKRLTVWDMVHHLIRVLEQGEGKAAALMAKLGTKAEVARELAYRLFSICDRTKRSQDALRYNALVQSWPEIVQLAQQVPARAQEQQQRLFGEMD